MSVFATKFLKIRYTISIVCECILGHFLTYLVDDMGIETLYEET
jgi:hypothetical protein